MRKNNEIKKEKNNEFIDVDCEEIKDGNINTKTKENQLVKFEESISMPLYKDNTFENIGLLPEKDIEYLKEHSEDYQERFINRSFFRSEFEMRYGVLSDSEHPTVDSKYYQSIGEQAVHVQEYASLEYEHKKLMADMELLKAEIEDLEYQLKQNFEHEFDRKKLRAKLLKKQVELDEKKFGVILQRKTAKERMREIKNWDKIISELKPMVKHGTDDFEKHHAERYIKRYGNRLLGLNMLDPENKEHVIKHFSSFAQAPENKEIAQKYIENYNKINKLPNQAYLPINNQSSNNKQITNSVDKQITNDQSSNLDFKSKQEMMEKEPITKKFFNRKVNKILIATPHRTKGEPNVTNFFKLQTPAAFDCELEQPYGMSVPDARNFIVDKAIKEDYQYIFFVDDDVLIPKNALVQLIHHKADVVGGFYFRKYRPEESCGMIEDENKIPVPIENFKIGDIIHNTLVLPSGCTLIKTDVFKKIKYPFYISATVQGRQAITEDTVICQKFKELGVDVITDLGIQCLHINKETGIIYGHKDIVDYEKNQVYMNWRDYFAI